MALAFPLSSPAFPPRRTTCTSPTSITLRLPLHDLEDWLPLASGLRDFVQEGLLRGGAALATVAGDFGIAEFGAATGQGFAQLFHADWLALSL